MDLEHLNKSQIVLLTLLVSFVTSIATGIVAVTLMEQAPPAITQTVNRIVERTVEKVVPQEGMVAAAATVTEKVTVYESDQLTAAIEKTVPIAVRLFGQGKDVYGSPIEIFLGLGVVASSDGLIFADATMMSDDAAVTVVRSDGVRVPAKVVGRDKDAGLVRLQAATSTETEKDGKKEMQPLTWTPGAFVKSAAQLGETVVVLSGQSSLKIANGIVTALPAGGEGTAAHVIETSIPAESYVVGSPLITVNGEVLGIATAGSRATSGGFLASSIVLSYNKPTEDEETASQ
ncbi:MAG: trypsin-like peptidase domain-containing protein [Patescibacteria group bacterium]